MILVYIGNSKDQWYFTPNKSYVWKGNYMYDSLANQNIFLHDDKGNVVMVPRNWFKPIVDIRDEKIDILIK